MKKVTLSAAVLALAMMGCSDAGLDNSVASTNDAKSVQNASNAVAALMKASDNEEDFLIHYEYRTSHYGVNFAFYGSSEVEESIDNRGIGEFRIYTSNNSKIDVINGITLNVADCRLDGQSAKCKYVIWNADRWFNVPSGATVTNRTDNTLHFIDRDRITTISTFAGVWNMGRSNEVIMSGSTYDGYLERTNNKYLAMLVAQKYLPMAAAEFENSHQY